MIIKWDWGDWRATDFFGEGDRIKSSVLDSV